MAYFDLLPSFPLDRRAHFAGAQAFAREQGTTT
jgi:hypothetical protein